MNAYDDAEFCVGCDHSKTVHRDVLDAACQAPPCTVIDCTCSSYKATLSPDWDTYWESA